MIEINKTTIGIAAGVAGTLFIGYCIYFDKKRRSDPEYKKKVRERRMRLRKPTSGVPDLNDHEQIERYFLQEIQLGESLISRGEFEKGVEHLSNAIIVCGQPGRLLQILQSSLPAQVFAMLIMKMQELGGRPLAGATTNESDSAANIVNANSVFGGMDSASSVIINDIE